MFIVSFKLNRIKTFAVTIAILLVVLLIISIFIKSKDVCILNTMQQEKTFKFDNIRTNEDRINFLRQFGWEVVENPIEIMEVKIPEEFDSVYTEYNKIQKEITLDLEKYKGKRVKRYTYKLLNYPGNIKAEVRANILVFKDRVIAGDIMTTQIDGFMHSLLYQVKN